MHYKKTKKRSREVRKGIVVALFLFILTLVPAAQATTVTFTNCAQRGKRLICVLKANLGAQSSVAPAQGTAGPQGPVGQQGVQGPAGQQGPQGLQGATGPTGSVTTITSTSATKTAHLRTTEWPTEENTGPIPAAKTSVESFIQTSPATLVNVSAPEVTIASSNVHIEDSEIHVIHILRGAEESLLRRINASFITSESPSTQVQGSNLSKCVECYLGLGTIENSFVAGNVFSQEIWLNHDSLNGIFANELRLEDSLVHGNILAATGKLSDNSLDKLPSQNTEWTNNVLSGTDQEVSP